MVVRIFKPNFFTKLLGSFLAISIIPLVFIGGISYGLLTRTLQDTVSRQAEKTVAKINENIDILTSEYGEIIISLLREDEQVRRALMSNTGIDTEAIRKKIMIMAGRRNAAIYIVNQTGTLAIATHPMPERFFPNRAIDKNLFQKSNNLKNGYIIYPLTYTNATGDRVAYCIVRAVRDEKDIPIGYIIVEIFKSHLEEIENNINTNLNLDIIILDPRLYTIANLRKPKFDGSINPLSTLIKNQKLNSGFFIKRVSGKKYLIAFHTSKYTRFVALGILPINLILENSNYLRMITFWTILGCLFICLLLAFVFSRNISHPIQTLVQSMKKVESGDLTVRTEYRRWDELGLLGKSFNNMVIRLQELLDNIVEKQRQLRRSELRALEAQINPHFLYNTLDSIKWLAKLNQVPEISTIATQLGKLLRTSISCEDELITVEESLKNIKSYLEIQKIRYHDKFEVLIDIDPESYGYRIPKLILQPIVENAIYHGLDNKAGNGNLLIKGQMIAETLVFEISDDGIGIEAEKVKSINSGNDLRSTRQSIGIQNVNRRIKLYYGEEFGITIQSQLGEGTTVVLRMPAVLENSFSIEKMEV